MPHPDPNENQGRGPKPDRVSGVELASLIVCAFILGMVVLYAVGNPR